MPDGIFGGGGADGTVSVLGRDGQPLVQLLARDTESVIGAGQTSRPGRLSMYDGKGQNTVSLTTADASLSLGGNNVPGTISVLGRDGQPLVQLLARDTESVIGAGHASRPGRLSMYDGKGQNTVTLTTVDASLSLGGNNVPGTVSVLGRDGQPLVQLLARDTESVVGAGQKGRPGRISLYDATGQDAVTLTAANATLALGGADGAGTITIAGRDGQPLVQLTGSDTESVVGAGQKGRPGRISLYDTDGHEAVRMDAANGGDIFIANGDLAEEFDLADANIVAGMVVILDETGGVAACCQAYDTRAAGVISGAGPFRPGLVLDKRNTQRRRLPVAMMGKVHCLVDAGPAPIRPGDLLTTAVRFGHAMRATDRARAMGAIIGKALAPLDAGEGRIPILVTLQ
jgi:hypothetical protein